MGMDLIPVYEDQVSVGSDIRIDPNTVQNMGVRSTVVEKKEFSNNIRTVGKVDYNEENITVVSTKLAGWIEDLHVDYTGKPVRKGQPLLELYSPDLVTTQQEYLLALKNKELIGGSSVASIREGAESLLKSTRQRLEYWDIPESEIRRLEVEGEVRKTITFDAPTDGVVIHKNAIEGQHVMAGMSLYKIADLSTVWVMASLYDNEVPWVEVGQRAEMELSYAPGKVLMGRVDYIYPYLNQKARDVQVRLVFPNPKLALKPGMYATVRIHSHTIPDAIVIPTESVIRSGERDLVFLDNGDGSFTPRQVRVGEEGANGDLRILSGLRAGERIVTSAQFLLDSESRLQEAIQKMLREKRGDGKATLAESNGSPAEMKQTMEMPEHEDQEHVGMEMEQDAPDKGMEHSGSGMQMEHEHVGMDMQDPSGDQ